MNQATIKTLPDLLPTIEPETIISRKTFSDSAVTVTLFGFAPGEELTEHTAAFPAVLHFLSGETTLTLGDEVIEAEAGTWVHMPANLPHSLQAKTAVTLLLYLLKGK